MSEWISVKDRLPEIGIKCLFYRPLAENTNDPVVAVKTSKKDDGTCWMQTVPDGELPCNPTDGYCHVTHWMPLPDMPA